MNLPGLLFLILTQFLAGRGLLAILNVKLKPLTSFVLSILMGILLLSLLPMAIQFFHVPITKRNIIITIGIFSLLMSLIPFRRYDFSIFKPAHIKFTFPYLYEIMFIGLFIALLIPGVWRCYYYPATARDVLSGPEALAEYAIKEHTLNNSVFSMNLLESTPNLLKPPFVTDLQIIYKMLVDPFGQVWLTMIVLCFMTWIYILLREKLHPLIAGMIMLFFIAIPEMYGYTYIVLWDYANMVYFFGGMYFLYQYSVSRQFSVFMLSCFLFGFATFVRLETIIFIGLLVPLLWLYLWKEKVKVPRIILQTALITGIPFLFYFVWVNLFVKHYFPINLNMENQIDFSPLVSYGQWFSLFNSRLLFGGIALPLYGYFVYFFIAVFLADAVFFRKFNNQAKFMLYGILIIYLGLPALTYLTPWFNETTAKRGYFKMFPLMVIYMRESAIFTRWSQGITNFEFPAVAQKKKAVQLADQPVRNEQGKKKKKKNK